jgi:glycosyltransferase involved in cell wall biosynthesis/GT2 family glycosyltransferase
MVLENSTYPLDARVRLEAESLVGRGLSVEVLAPREPGRPVRELIDGVYVTRFPLIDGRGELLGTAAEYLVSCCAIAAAVLPRLACKRRGTLHVHNPPDFFFPLLWIARRRGWSSVFDHHDDAAGMLRAKIGRATPVESVLAWMRRRSAAVADLTITTNDTQRELLEADARRVVVVRNCPPAWFADHRPAPPTGRARLVFLGEIGEQDRVERTVDLLCELVNGRGLDVELLIIGDGPRRRAVELRAEQLDVVDRVNITGWVAFEEVPGLLASAHVGLDTAPSTDVNNNSTMVKIIEYLVVGLPVVATALSETLVTGGEAIVTVEEDSLEAFVAPLVELLTSTERWSASAARARARGRELLWPTQAERLLAAYRDLDAGRTHRREAAPGRPRKWHSRARVFEYVARRFDKRARVEAVPSAGSPASGGRLPTVSVIVPCYNYGRFLEGCVASVLGQQGVETEVLVIDDRSTDSSAEIGRRVAERDARVEFRQHRTNLGATATINEGLEWARGDYVVVLDADDLLVAGALRRAATVMAEHPNVGMVHGRALYAHEGRPLPGPSGQWRGTAVWAGRDWIERRCRSGHNCVSAPTVMVRSAVQRAVGGYDSDCFSYDVNMWLRIAAVADIAHVRAHQAIYRVHTASMSHSEVGALAKLRPRRVAFDSFFAKGAEGVAGHDSLHAMASRTLARQALWRASRAVDRGDQDQTTVDDLIAFALDTYPDSMSLREWRGLRLRRRIGSGRSLIFFPFLVTGAIHRARARAGWMLLGRRGI